MHPIPFASEEDREFVATLRQSIELLERELTSPLKTTRVKLILYWYLQATANRIREENPAEPYHKDMGGQTIGEAAAARIQEYALRHLACPTYVIAGIVDTAIADALVVQKLKDGTLRPPSH